MEKHQLRYFFWELLRIAYKCPGPNGWGNPCSHLLEYICTRPSALIDRIAGDFSNDSHEFRLNGAGLKMYWIVERENKIPCSDSTSRCKFKCRIGGDQANMYPEFVEAANQYLKEKRLYKGSY
jgi:hypothetical protein